MPTIEELEQLKKNLDRLQDEPDYAQSQGWVIEEVAPPSEDEILMPRPEDLMRSPVSTGEDGADRPVDRPEEGEQNQDDQVPLVDWDLDEPAALEGEDGSLPSLEGKDEPPPSLEGEPVSPPPIPAEPPPPGGPIAADDRAAAEEPGSTSPIDETVPAPAAQDEDELAEFVRNELEEREDSANEQDGGQQNANATPSDIISDLEKQIRSINGEQQDQQEQVNREEEFQGKYIPLTAHNLAKINRNLDNYPLNLKIAIENEIGNGNLNAESVDELLGLIIKGVSPKNLANRFFELSAKRVLLPKTVVMRLSQEERERRYRKFSYQFGQLAWPWLRVYFLFLLALAALLLVCFHFFYRPLASELLYRQGIKKVAIDQYKEAEQLFSQARYGWQALGLKVKGLPAEKWYLRYAAAYRSRYNFIDAEAKYRAMIADFPTVEEGWQAYTTLLLRDTHEYRRAIEILRLYQDRFERSPGFLLLLADSYLALMRENPSYYSETEKNYVDALLSSPRNDDHAALSMLHFLLVEERLSSSPKRKKAIQSLLTDLLAKKEIVAQNGASVLSEASRYMIDQKKYRAAHSLLRRALEHEQINVDVYTQFAYYYRQMNEKSREKQALSAAFYYLSNQKNDELKLSQRLYSYLRLAQLHLDSDQGAAVNWFRKAVQAVDYAQQRSFRYSDQITGELYSNVGDVLFENYRFDKSQGYYLQAKKVDYDQPQVNFRLGYTYYRQQEWRQALNSFHQVQQLANRPPMVDYALATTLFQTENWQSAAGFYGHARQSLDRQLESLSSSSTRRLQRRQLQQLKMKSLNNEAAALYNYYLQTGGQDALQAATQNLTESINLLDELSRENEFKLKLNQEELERETLLSISELDRLEQNPRDVDLVRNSLPRQNFFTFFHPQQKLDAQFFELTSEEMVDTNWR